MKTTDIIDVYKSKLKKISGYYQKVLEEFEMNDIHRLRVEIKKLRAFMRLMNLATPGQQHRIPKSLKKFYNTVGSFRNLQLHQQKIAGFTSDLLIESPPQYLRHLKEEEKSMKRKALALADTISLKEFERTLVASSTADLSQQVKTVFVQRSRLRLEAMLTLPFYYDEGLHDMRKLIKDLMYNYKYLKPAIDVEIPPALANLKAMEELTSWLGDFYDLCMALFFVSAVYIGDLFDEKEVTLLNALKEQVQIRKEAMKEELIHLLTPLKEQIAKERLLIRTQEVL